MIHRLLIEDLTEWSKRKNRKPLVLRGARQVGKTTLIDEFSKQYDCYIKLNLEQSSDAKAFGISDNVAEIFQYICLQKKIVADKNKRTLLFIDEIQNEPKAVGLLRYFYEENAVAAHRSCRLKATDTYKATHIVSGRTCGIHVVTPMFVPRIFERYS